MDSALNVNHPKQAYQIGRLMAVLEMIQWQANGEVGATIAQTHYASAATRPIAALPRLETLVQHHLPKIRQPLRQQYRGLLTEIKHRIRDTIPRTFDLEDQCLFHLGYYHQRAYRPHNESPHKHLTLNGEKVRSKSEVIVANILSMLGIPYEYEAELRFENGGLLPSNAETSEETRSIRPDFTIRETADGMPVFIEHLGMMDNLAYRSDWERRKELFESLGIRDRNPVNGRLIVTEERNGTIDCQKLVAALQELQTANSK